MDRKRRRAVVLAVALAGVVLAHGLAYLVVLPGRSARDAVLTETGHGYWPVLVPVAALAGLLALALVIVAPLSRRIGPSGSSGPTTDLPFVSLAAGQLALFCGIEIAERLAISSPIEHLWQRPEFALGLVLQLVVALVAVAIVRAADHLATSVAARSITRPWPRPLALIARVLDARVRPGWQLGSTARAPPLFLAP
jgi:MFS superfamily sulfate permease-like transporter